MLEGVWGLGGWGWGMGEGGLGYAPPPPPHNPKSPTPNPQSPFNLIKKNYISNRYNLFKKIFVK